MSKTVLITGTNRGIGLELVKQYAHDKWNVIACCRKPEISIKLHEIAFQYPNIKVSRLDVCSSQSIGYLKDEIKYQPIDLIINNAGIYRKDPESRDIAIEDIVQTFLTNSVAPLKISEALIDNLLKSELKLIVVITSRLGSIGFNTVSGHYSYRASKAAVNMLMKNFSIDWKDKGIRVLLLHPGWVKTDMNENKAPLDISISVAGLRKVIMDKKDAPGIYYDYTGQEIPW